ncbi:MAG: hypothetical protein DRG78_22895 [Epsilonproteobacteria bacterium]|nr:MAG: hypothetical protein DRG78_22895 [Campylobacterota bacterium]
MLNTRDLEERWLKYKIKSYIPYAIIVVSLVVIILITSIFFNANKKEKELALVSEIKQEKQIENTQSVATTVIEKTEPKKIIVEIKKEVTQEVPKTINLASQNNLQKSSDEPFKLSPSLDFMKKMQHSSLPYHQNEPVQQQKSTSPVIEEVQDLGIEENVEIALVEEKPEKITIKRRDSSDDIRHIIKRFKKNNNPALSLFIAKKYYEMGEYHKAYNYALITNEIDRNIDASWIVFTKSLVKLDQKDMAIKTLRKYIENSHSSSAKILLDEILAGKFK